MEARLLTEGHREVLRDFIHSDCEAKYLPNSGQSGWRGAGQYRAYHLPCKPLVPSEMILSCDLSPHPLALGLGLLPSV